MAARRICFPASVDRLLYKKITPVQIRLMTRRKRDSISRGKEPRISAISPNKRASPIDISSPSMNFSYGCLI